MAQNSRVDATPVAETYAERASGKNLHFTCQLPYHPVNLAVQPELLKQAVLNLLENAYRYTPADGHIALRLIAQSERILIQIEDSGIGIPPEGSPSESVEVL